MEHTFGQVVAAAAVPVVLGGDHSITEPNVHAVGTRHRPVGLVHFDTHTDTGNEVFGVERSHETPMYRLVRDGFVDGSRYVQIGLRGYWPGPTEFAWQHEQGVTSFFMHDVVELGSGRSSSGRSTSSTQALSSLRSPSMSSTPRSHREPGRPNRAA
jgi:agmatinase